MKKPITVLLTSLMFSFSPLLLAATNADATDNDPALATMEQDGAMKNVRDKLKKMSPQQRKAMMSDAKKKWDSLSEADKQAFRAKSKDRVEKIQARMEKRHKEMMENNGERIYMRLYAIEQVK